MSEEDDPSIAVFETILKFEIPLVILFIANMYLAFTGSGFWSGYNKIITSLVGAIILFIFVISYLVIQLPDTDEDVSLVLSIGMLLPIFLTIIYACIAIYYVVFKRSSSVNSSNPGKPALTPVAVGGGRHKRSKK